MLNQNFFYEEFNFLRFKMAIPQPVTQSIIFQHLQGKKYQEIQSRYKYFLQRSEQPNYDRRKNCTKLTFIVKLLIKYFNQESNGYMTGMTISNKVFNILQLRVCPNTINQYRHSLGTYFKKKLKNNI